MSRGRELANVRDVPDRIVVPDLSGVIVAGALRRAAIVGFTLAVADPPRPIKELASSGRWVVAGQDPAPGAERYRGDTVVVTVRHEGGGSAGDREPRNPLPRRLSDRAPLPEDLGVPLEQGPPIASVHSLDDVRARGLAGADAVDQSDG
jgi:hypothetical protein